MTASAGLSVVVPAKALARAKSRLALQLVERQELALAMLGATVETVLSAELVTVAYVVTSDPRVADVAAAAGAQVVRESVPRGINDALQDGRRAALAQRPHGPVAMVVADLPYLRSGDLDDLALQHRSAGVPMVAVDRDGTGTTALLHGPDETPVVAFGPGSAAAHLRAGYRPAHGALGSLRHDVDTLSDLDPGLPSPALDRWLAVLSAAELPRSA